MKQTLISVILMVHNEEKTIADEIQSYYKELIRKLPRSELIIAEDGSTDKTRDIIYSLSKSIPLVLLVTPEKRGYATSLQLALKKAQGEYILYADAGNKHDPNDFWKLYEKIKKYDVVIGYKYKRQDPAYRLFLAWGLNTLIGLYFGYWFKDIDCGFKLMNKNARDIILKRPLSLKEIVSSEIMLRASYSKLQITEVPVKHIARKFGPSRGLPLKKIPRVVIMALRNFPKLKKELREFNV